GPRRAGARPDHADEDDLHARSLPPARGGRGRAAPRHSFIRKLIGTGVACTISGCAILTTPLVISSTPMSHVVSATRSPSWIPTARLPLASCRNAASASLTRYVNSASSTSSASRFY